MRSAMAALGRISGVKIDGTEGLVNRLEALDSNVKTTITKILRMMARPIISSVRSQLKRNRTGLLKQSISVVIRKPKARRGYAVIGAKRGIKASVRRAKFGKTGINAEPANYAHLVEYGTAPHRIYREVKTASGKSRKVGWMHPGARAYPFFRPGVRMAGPQAMAIAKRELNDAILRAVRASR